MEQFPPNSSKKPEARSREPKKIERVISSEVSQRKQTLGSRFSQTFISGDAKTAIAYAVASIVIPEIKQLIVDFGTTVLERVVQGDSKPRRHGGISGSGPLGRITTDYAAMHSSSRTTVANPAPSRQARTRHDFRELIFQTRADADEVLERMFDILSKYDTVTVADLYGLVGINSTHTDHKWGWYDIRPAGIDRLRGGGYVLSLPEPRSVD